VSLRGPSRHDLALRGAGGRTAAWTAGSIRARFGPLGAAGGGGTTAVPGTVPDRSALRDLPELMWDTGSTIAALSVDGSPRRHRPTISVTDEEPTS
jgi:hypothetical protein